MWGWGIVPGNNDCRVSGFRDPILNCIGLHMLLYLTVHCILLDSSAETDLPSWAREPSEVHPLVQKREKGTTSNTGYSNVLGDLEDQRYCVGF